MMTRIKITLISFSLLTTSTIGAYSFFEFANALDDEEVSLGLEPSENFLDLKVVFNPFPLSWNGDPSPIIVRVKEGNSINAELVPANPRGTYFTEIFSSWGVEGIPFSLNSEIGENLVLTPILRMQSISVSKVEYSFHNIQKQVAVTSSEHDVSNIEIISNLDSFPVSRIVSGAFMGRNDLVTADIPSSVVLIDAIAFTDSRNLKNLKLREGLQTIGAKAFENCSALGMGQTLTLPSSVLAIGGGAFAGISGLTIDASLIPLNVYTTLSPGWAGTASVIPPL